MLSEMTTAYRQSNALFAFVESQAPLYLTIQDGKTVEQLAQLCHVSQDRFHRLLNYMQTLNVLTKKEDKFYLTEQSAALNDPNSLETLHIKFELSPSCWNCWSQYSASLSEMSSKSAFELHHNEKLFDYYSQKNNQDIKTTFDNFMAKLTHIMGDYIIQYMPLKGVSSVMDIGGGLGSLAKNIKAHYPHIQCHVMDQYDFTRKESEEITFMNGNFFSAIPSGYDAYCMKHILHNWPDNKAIEILKNCHEAMNDNSVLYVIEMIKEPHDPVSESFDLFMDALLLGIERNLAEFEFIAKQAGLAITNKYNINYTFTGSNHYIIEMRK
jgi:ubiquinone/menaquinone biosynthesis C-methylase UbiE